MKNYIQHGKTISIIAPADGIVSGQGVLQGALFGIAATTANAGEGVDICTTGVFSLPKNPSATFANGSKVSWDDDSHWCDVPAAGRYPIGASLVAVGSGAATLTVRLDGITTIQAV